MTIEEGRALFLSACREYGTERRDAARQTILDYVQDHGMAIDDWLALHGGDQDVWLRAAPY